MATYYALSNAGMNVELWRRKNGSWRLMTTISTGSPATATAIWILSESAVYIGLSLDNGDASIHQWNGSSVSSLYTISENDFDHYIWSIWGTSENNIYFSDMSQTTGGAGAVWRWDGNSASKSLDDQTNLQGSSRGWTGLWGSGANNIWAVSDEDVSSFESEIYHYNGTVWTVQYDRTNDFWADGSSRCLYGVSSSEVYAVGSTNGGTTAQILRWNGSTWVEDFAPGGSPPYFQWVWAGPRLAHAAMDSGTPSERKIYSKVSGGAWTLSATSVRAQSLTGDGRAGKASAYVDDSASTISFWDYCDGTWGAPESTPATLEYIALVPSSVVPRIISCTSSVDAPLLELVSGEWIEFSPPPPIPFQWIPRIAGTDSGLWIYADNDDFWFFDGHSWIQSDNISGIKDFYVICDEEIYACSDSSVYFYDGNIWSLHSNFPNSSVPIFSIWASSETDIWAVGGSFSNNRIWHYDGVSWSNLYQSSIGSNPRWVDGISPTQVYILTSAGRVMLYNGSSFTSLGGVQPLPSLGRSSMTVLDGSNIWVITNRVVEEYIGRIHKWNGTSIVEESVGVFGFSIEEGNIVSLSSTELYAVDGGASFYSDGSGIWTQHTLGDFSNSDFRDLTVSYAPKIVPLFVINRNPFPDQTQVSIDSLVEMSVVGSHPIVPSSVDVYLDAELAYDGLLNAFIPPYDGAQSSFEFTIVDGYDGYRIIVDHIYDFESFQTIETFIHADDYAGNMLDSYWSFRVEDTDPPVFENETPADGTTEIGRDAVLSVGFYDIGSGIDMLSVSASVGGILAYVGGSFLSPFNGPLSSLVAGIVDGYDGYIITIDRIGNWPSGREIEVLVQADDAEGN